jgi:hypothetical protein
MRHGVLSRNALPIDFHKATIHPSREPAMTGQSGNQIERRKPVSAR